MMLVPRVDAPVAVAAGVALLVPAYVAARRLLRAYLVRKYTVLSDLPALGSPRPARKLAGTAVVCGGSFAGLFAARVCADHFERVVVVEPESWTFTDEAKAKAPVATREVAGETATYNTVQHKRSRVYQYAAIHAFQTLLLDFARKICPDFDAAAKRWGVLIWPGDSNVSFGGFAMRAPWDEYDGKLPELLSATRRNLEPLFRKLIAESCTNVEFVNGTVVSFVTGADGSISEVAARVEDGSTVSYPCALVADCTGSSQVGLKLLSRAVPSLPTDLREVYDPDTAYTTLEFPLPPNFDDDLRALKIPYLSGHALYDTDSCHNYFVYNPDPKDDSRFLAVMRRDTDGVIMCFGGWGTELPVCLDEARSFTLQVKNANHIPDYFYKLLDLLEPVADECIAYPARTTACWKVHYERAAKQLPHNFVALGDASLRVNPRFGQGVSKCAIGATTLDGVLRRLSPSSKKFGPTFFARMDSRTANIWDGTRLSDYDNASTVPLPGETHETGRFARWFRSKLLRIVSKNTTASSALWHVMNFRAPPTDLFAPSIIASVVWESIFPSV